MRRLFDIHVLTLVVATSYVTLGIAAPSKAASTWAVYAGLTFVLALINLVRTCR